MRFIRRQSPIFFVAGLAVLLIGGGVVISGHGVAGLLIALAGLIIFIPGLVGDQLQRRRRAPGARTQRVER